MDIISTPQPAQAAGTALGETLRNYQEDGLSVLLLVSGGSALALLQYVPEKSLGNQLTFGVLDERWTQVEAEQNFTQLTQTDFFSRAVAAGSVPLESLNTNEPSCVSAALKFASVLQKWRQENPTGVVIVTMGVGIDGHTAGIFPGDVTNEMNGSSLVVGYRLPPKVNPYTERITVTNTFLKNWVAATFVYVVGKEKKLIVQKLSTLLETTTNTSFPAGVFAGMKNVRIFTDQLPQNPPQEQKNNPLHGVRLNTMVEELVTHYGWEALGEQIKIKCFITNPSVISSLKFLRKTPWARTKVEDYYRFTFYTRVGKRKR